MAADARRPNDGQLGPAVEKAGQRTIGPAQIDVFAAGVRIGAGQFGEAQSADQGEDAAERPDEHDLNGAGSLFENVLRHFKYADADDDADDNARRIPQAEIGLRSLAFRAGGVHVAPAEKWVLE